MLLNSSDKKNLCCHDRGAHEERAREEKNPHCSIAAASSSTSALYSFSLSLSSPVQVSAWTRATAAFAPLLLLPPSPILQLWRLVVDFELQVMILLVQRRGWRWGRRGHHWERRCCWEGRQGLGCREGRCCIRVSSFCTSRSLQVPCSTELGMTDSLALVHPCVLLQKDIRRRYSMGDH
jgi:hypothetical protein